MTVMHVENNDITRESLARLLGVTEGRLGDHRYLSTGIVSAAKQQFRTAEVKILILDLGLNAAWDNKHMRAALRNLAWDEPLDDPTQAGKCEAYALALLAHQHHARCVLLTNYADYTGGDPPLTREKLGAAFHAQAVFAKDEQGQQACALWVKDALGF